MLDLFTDAFGSEITRRALLGGLLAATITALVGTWVVLRGLAFFGDAMAHGVLPGIALAVIWGFDVTLGAVLSALVSLENAYIVVCQGDLANAVPEHWRIDIFALFAAVSWGIFSALARKWPHEPLSGMFIFLATGLVISAVVLPFTPGRHYLVGWEIYGAFHVGFICNTVAALLWLAALRSAGVSLVGNIALLTAFVNLVFIRLLLPNQTLHWSAVVGLTVIVSGVLLSRTGKPKLPEEPPA